MRAIPAILGAVIVAATLGEFFSSLPAIGAGTLRDGYEDASLIGVALLLGLLLLVYGLFRFRGPATRDESGVWKEGKEDEDRRG